jgi:hypothetical protein
MSFPLEIFKTLLSRDKRIKRRIRIYFICIQESGKSDISRIRRCFYMNSRPGQTNVKILYLPFPEKKEYHEI